VPQLNSFTFSGVNIPQAGGGQKRERLNALRKLFESIRACPKGMSIFLCPERLSGQRKKMNHLCVLCVSACPVGGNHRTGVVKSSPFYFHRFARPGAVRAGETKLR